eukprot:171335-Pleurochrysis_carterae.AAC.1
MPLTKVSTSALTAVSLPLIAGACDLRVGARRVGARRVGARRVDNQCRMDCHFDGCNDREIDDRRGRHVDFNDFD